MMVFPAARRAPGGRFAQQTAVWQTQCGRVGDDGIRRDGSAYAGNPVKAPEPVEMPARHRSQPPSQFRCRAPLSRRATLHAEYSTKQALQSSPHWLLPMDTAGRHYLCARCRKAVIICSHCDRGQRYCTQACATQARHTAARAAGCRYQDSRRGRHAHAERQRLYRAKHKEVTHQGSPPDGPAVPLRSEPTVPAIAAHWHCCRCHRPLPNGVRQDFLRCRIRRHPTDRSKHGHSP